MRDSKNLEFENFSINQKKPIIMNTLQVYACKGNLCASAKFNGNALFFFLLGAGTIVALNYYQAQRLNK